MELCQFIDPKNGFALIELENFADFEVSRVLGKKLKIFGLYMVMPKSKERIENLSENSAARYRKQLKFERCNGHSASHVFQTANEIWLESYDTNRKPGI